MKFSFSAWSVTVMCSGADSGSVSMALATKKAPALTVTTPVITAATTESAFPVPVASRDVAAVVFTTIATPPPSSGKSEANAAAAPPSAAAPRRSQPLP